MLFKKQISNLAKIWTVSELNEEIRKKISALGYIWLTGELTNVRHHLAKGHIYFSIKDKNEAIIEAVIFQIENIPPDFQIRDGLDVIVYGKVTYYTKGGKVNIIVEYIEPKGLGQLYLEFIALKEKLEKEGLFEEAHKKPIPFLPQRIGIITSPEGAVIKDILRVIYEKNSRASTLLYPAQVQGEGAALDIVSGITFFNDEYKKENSPFKVDVIILARGGGSLEDLWAFNEEILARAIFQSEIPIISAVGHESDITISDLVADVRAPTPTKAGEMVIPAEVELESKLRELRKNLDKEISNKISHYKNLLDSYSKSYTLGRYADILGNFKRELDENYEKMVNLMQKHIKDKRQKLDYLNSSLNNLNPLNILRRGYSITRIKKTAQGFSDKAGKIIKSVKDIEGVKEIITQVSDGEFNSTINQEFHH